MLTKSCPRVRGKWHEVPKGVRLKTAECRELFPLSFAYAQQLPRFTVEPLGAVQTRRTVPYPSRSDRFNGVTGGAGGPKGRNRNLPRPPCKKGYKETPFSFVYLNPSVTACAVPAPRPGSLLERFISSHIKPALKGEVDMSVSEWTEGLYRGYCCLRQPLRQSALRA